MAEANHNGPLLSGSFEVGSHSENNWAVSNATAQDTIGLRLEGDWRPEEVRYSQFNNGAAVIFGACLAGQEQIDQAIETAIRTNDPSAISRLPGSYTALLIEPQQVRAVADLAGQFPLYYRQDSTTLHFSSTTEPLRAGSGAQPDVSTFAAQLAVSDSPHLIHGRSAVAGISRLDGGHVLTFGGKGASVEAYETFATPKISTLDEAAELLRTALLEGTRLRAGLGRRLSADFSGGYDSTSLAYLIARKLREPLLTTTRHSPDAPTDDIAYVRRFLDLPASKGLFDARLIERPSAQAAYRDLLAMPAGDEPDLGVTVRAADIEYYAFLKDQGSELHLTGSAADAILDLDPRHYLGGLARPSTYRQFIRSIFEVARTELTSPTAIARDVRTHKQVGPAIRMGMLADVLLGKKYAAAQHLSKDILFGAGAAPEWLTPTARRAVADLAAEAASRLATLPIHDRGNYEAYSLVRVLAANLHSAMQFVASQGMRQHAVFMDNAVLRACLDLASHQRVNPWTFKAILVKALEGIVPPEIVRRSTKGDYSKQGLIGLRAAHDTLSGLLRDSYLADLGVVEPRAVKKTLDSIAMGANPPWAALDRLIATEAWLRNLHGPRKTEVDLPIPAREKPQEAPPLPSEAVFGMPKGVLLAVRQNGAVAVNMPSGTYHRMNADAASVVLALRDKGNVGRALIQLQKQYPSVDAKEIEAGVTTVIGSLVRQGILSSEVQGFAIKTANYTSGSVPAAMTRQQQESTRVRLRDLPAAVGGLIVTALLKQFSTQRQFNALASVRNRLARRQATQEQASRTHAAVKKVATLYMGRAACLEIAMGTVLASALQGGRVDLVLGVKSDPDAFHAWPEVGESPIRNGTDLPIATVFAPLVKI